jgi:hypothetical protein
MELLDRYLHAVRQYLPEAQQDDIIRELSENIRSQQEDQETQLGRPLREDEREAMLKQLGHPMLVAGRYLPHKHLIGPAVFPYYWYTLKGTLWIVLLVYIIAACTTPFVAGLVTLTSRTSVPELVRSPNVALLFWGGITVLLAAFGILTIGFALLDLFQVRYHLLDKWNPRQLAPVPKIPAELLGRPVSRPQAISELAIGVVFILCWLTIPQFPMILGPGTTAILQAGAGWPIFRLLMLALVLLGSANAGLGLVRPHWRRALLPLVHAMRAAGVLWMFFLARSGTLVAAANSAAIAPGVDPNFVVRVVNSSIAYGALLGLCFTVLNYGVALARFLSRYIRQRSGAAAIHLANF